MKEAPDTQQQQQKPKKHAQSRRTIYSEQCYHIYIRTNSEKKHLLTSVNIRLWLCGLTFTQC